MSAPCPDPELLSAYRAGRLDPPEQASLEAHAAGCARCLEALRVLGGLPDAQTPRRIVWVGRVAAAAALLGVIAVGWALMPRDDRRDEASPARVQAVRPSFPEGLLGRQERPVALLGGGVDLVLSEGARVRAERSSRALRLEAGTIWVDAGRGAPVTVQVPGARLVLETGLLAVRVAPAPRGAGWIREAKAEDGETAEAWLLEGALTVVAPGGEIRVVSEARMDLRGKTRMLPLPEAERDRLLRARTDALAAIPGRELFAPGASLDAGRPRLQASGSEGGSYRWVTVLSGRKSGTELRLDFPVEGAWHSWTLGIGGEPPAAREVVELAWDGECLVGRVNGRRRFAMDLARLQRELPCQSPGGWALSGWGGSVKVDRAVLQEAQP
jgi:hypothetical protein